MDVNMQAMKGEMQNMVIDLQNQQRSDMQMLKAGQEEMKASW